MGAHPSGKYLALVPFPALALEQQLSYVLALSFLALVMRPVIGVELGGGKGEVPLAELLGGEVPPPPEDLAILPPEPVMQMTAGYPPSGSRIFPH